MRAFCAQAALELLPTQDRQIAEFRSDARTLPLSLAGTAEVLARLRQTCSGTQRR